MRATLTIDDDLAKLLRRQVREEGVSFEEAVNRALRVGLGKTADIRSSARPKTIPHSFGFKAGIDVDKLSQLADQLEAESYVNSTGNPPGRQHS